MTARLASAALAALLALALPAQAANKPTHKPKPTKTTAEILAAAPAADWRDVDAANLLVMTLPQGRVLIELAPRFAPAHADNIRTLARATYFDGLAVLRVQDNFVTQWGDPDGEDAARAKPLAPAKAQLPAEFAVPLKGLPLATLPERDGWARRNGFVDGFAVAADPARGQAWLAHCYGVVGAGRGDAVDSSTGAELYAVIGHAPRALDRNITVVGRVLAGMEHLAALPRGGVNMGFYDDAAQRTAIRAVRLAAELPAAERPQVQVLRTESATWRAILDARRHRGGWYVKSPGRVELCGLTVPMRDAPTKPE